MLTKGEFDRFGALARKKLTWIPRNVGKGSLLSSLCKCGVCGATLQVTGSRGLGYYGCANRIRPPKGDKRCVLPLIPKAKLERHVMRRIAEFLLDDGEFKRALALASSSRPTRTTAAVLERQQEQVATEARKVQGRLDRLVKAVADGIIDADEARAERERIRAEQDRLADRQAELEQQRAGLRRKIERVRLIERTRTYFARMVKRAEDLEALPTEDRRDLLRSLLPTGGGSCIKVMPWKAPKYPEAFPGWRIEISGLLPVERAELEKAVLGGALAVP